MSRTILIMAGGTGGHVFPGLAVADEMRARGWRVVWMGARGGLESRLVPARGYPVEWIRAVALRGRGLAAKLLLPLNLLIGFWQSGRAIFRIRPDVVLGMGGYVAFPGGMMASLFARPLVVHEQNAIAGLANRVLAGVADKSLAAFPGALKNAEWTGNPVRAEIAAMAQPAARYAGRSGPLRLLVVGGSLGAQALNDAVPKALALISEGVRPSVLHQAGEKNIAALNNNYQSSGVRGELVAFIEDMARRYAEADLVICRAGAMTIAELSAGGMASVLVPFPHAVDDHQSANARFLSEHGAAILISQEKLTPEGLADLIRSLDRKALLVMAEKARLLGKPEAARIVADRCVELVMGTSG
jgi:UDP-N-acetylglucosamine--N-acetylmuramyl-(pentapeptide) pyrophosphoryl-undecaprenol N-acetylglucosamine transferase